jgi:putative FmdB family regulatory protein
MPIYGFACKTCAHEFETLVRADDVPACPDCGSKKLDQKLSLIASPAKTSAAAAPFCEGGVGACSSGCSCH